MYVCIFGLLVLCCWAGFSLVVETGAYLQLQYMGVSLRRLLLLQSMGSRACESQQLQHVGLVAVASRLQSTGSGVVPQAQLLHDLWDQGWNLCLLRWQAGSLPRSNQGSPRCNSKNFSPLCCHISLVSVKLYKDSLIKIKTTCLIDK